MRTGIEIIEFIILFITVVMVHQGTKTLTVMEFVIERLEIQQIATQVDGKLS